MTDTTNKDRSTAVMYSDNEKRPLSQQNSGDRKQNLLAQLKKHVMTTMPCLLPNHTRYTDGNVQQPCVSIITAALQYIEILEESIADNICKSNMKLDVHRHVNFYTDNLNSLAEPSNKDLGNMQVLLGDDNTPTHLISRQHVPSHGLPIAVPQKELDVNDVALTVEVQANYNPKPLSEQDRNNIYFTNPALTQSLPASCQNMRVSGACGSTVMPTAAVGGHATSDRYIIGDYLNLNLNTTNNNNCSALSGIDTLSLDTFNSNLSVLADVAAAGDASQLLDAANELCIDDGGAAANELCIDDGGAAANELCIDDGGAAANELCIDDGGAAANRTETSHFTNTSIDTELFPAASQVCEDGSVSQEEQLTMFTSTPIVPTSTTDINGNIMGAEGIGCAAAAGSGITLDDSLLVSPVSCQTQVPSQLFCSGYSNISAAAATAAGDTSLRADHNLTPAASTSVLDKYSLLNQSG